MGYVYRTPPKYAAGHMRRLHQQGLVEIRYEAGTLRYFLSEQAFDALSANVGQ